MGENVFNVSAVHIEIDNHFADFKIILKIQNEKQTSKQTNEQTQMQESIYIKRLIIEARGDGTRGLKYPLCSSYLFGVKSSDLVSFKLSKHKISNLKSVGISLENRKIPSFSAFFF